MNRTTRTLAAAGALSIGAALLPATAVGGVSAASIKEIPLSAPNAAVDDGYGYGTAASDKVVAVGSPDHQVGANASQGAVYVYSRPHHGWQKLGAPAVLTGPSGAANDEFGVSTALSGKYLFVGANGRAGSGAVYVFKRPSSGWKTSSHPIATLTASGAPAGIGLGGPIAASGDTVAVGAVGHDSNTGAIYVFTKPNAGWHTMTQTAILTSSENTAGDDWGDAVAIDGDTIVGSTWLSQSVRGNADVFVRPASGWQDATETRKLTAAGLSGGDEFGVSLGIDGDTVMVGASGHDLNGTTKGGTVFVFHKPAGGWGNSAKALKTKDTIAVTGGLSDSSFGDYLALNGKHLVICAATANSAQGQVYLLERPGSGWTTTTVSNPLVASDGQAGDLFGKTPAISKHLVLIGAEGKNSSAGGAYLYAFPGPTLSKVAGKSHSRLGFAIDEAAKVTVTLRKHGHKKAAFHRHEKVGRHSIKVSGNHLHGKYAASVVAKNSNGTSKTRHTTVHVG